MRTWLTLALLVSAALAGCAGDEAPTLDSTDDDGTDDQSQTATSTETTTPPPSDENETTDPEPEANTPPTAKLTADAVNGTAPLNVTFTIEASDADGDDLTWELFLDGIQITKGREPTATTTYNFTEAGNFTLRLVVEDDESSAEANVTVRVADAVPEPVLHTMECHVDAGVGNPAFSFSDGNGIGGCNLGTLPSPGDFVSGEIPDGCGVSYDADGDGLSDGDIGDTSPHPTNHNFSAFCDLGVLDVDVAVTFDLNV